MEQIFENEQYILKILHDDNSVNPRTWDNIGRMICFHRRYDLGDLHDFKCAREFFVHLAEKFMTTESGLKVVGEYVDKIISQFTIVYSPEDGRYIIDSDNVYNPFTETYETEEAAGEKLDAYRQELMDNPNWDEFSDEDLWAIFGPHVVILPLYLLDHSVISISTKNFGDPWDSGLVGWIYATREKFIRETGYMEDELFSTDKHRLPKVGEHVKIAGHDEWGKVTEINGELITVDFDFNKAIAYRTKENLITVTLDQVTEVMSQQAKRILMDEVETYDQHLRGDVYGFALEKKEKCDCCGHVETVEVGSTWGFYGSDFKENGLYDCLIKSKVPKELIEQLG